MVTVGQLVSELEKFDPSSEVEIEVRNELGSQRTPRGRDLKMFTVRTWVSKTVVELFPR